LRSPKHIRTLRLTTLLVALLIIAWILVTHLYDNVRVSPPVERAPTAGESEQDKGEVDPVSASALAPPETRAVDTRQRLLFLSAEEALKTGDVESFALLAEALRDYPLHPYLEYAALRRGIDAADSATVNAFLERHRDTPLASRLRDAWLNRMATEGRWADYARFQVPATTAAWRCRSLRALIEIGREQEAFAGITPLWLTGRSQSKECDPVFTAWRQAGALTPELIWERIGLAMDSNNPQLADYLKGLLPEGERHWVDDWLAIHKDPTQIIDGAGGLVGHPLPDLVLAHGLTRLAQTDAAAAAYAWEQMRQHLSFPSELAERTTQRLGLRLLSSDVARGLDLLGAIRATEVNLDFQDRRLRAALEQQAWGHVADWIAAMPDGEHKHDHWLYWHARAEDALGHHELAANLYRRAAEGIGLWGLLAADRVGIPYSLRHAPTPADPERIRRVEESAAMARIRELRELGRSADMRREWRELTGGMGPPDLLAAAIAAQRLAWHDQAIFTLARAEYWDDLELRFPLAYSDPILQQAAETRLDPAWVLAIARQESVFSPHIVSHAGAIGLMQLMPATAREVAARIDLPTPSPRDLSDPGLNLRLGTAYLAQMEERFNGHPALASAAYNAGPHRVERWLPKQPLAADLWIATIPFNETRGYVRRVLAYRAIYAARLGQTTQRVMDTLPDVVEPPPTG